MDVEDFCLSTCKVIVCIFRGGSRNVEGGTHIVQARRKQFISGTGKRQCIEVHITDLSARNAENFFTFIFQLSGLALIAPSCFALHC